MILVERKIEVYTMRKNEITIDIADCFSRHPAGRVASDGPDNGERFRDEILVPALRKAMELNEDTRVIVDIDGCRSLGSTFLEEAFGGLARIPAFPILKACKILQIIYRKPYLQIYKDAILEYLDDAKAQGTT